MYLFVGHTQGPVFSLVAGDLSVQFNMIHFFSLHARSTALHTILKVKLLKLLVNTAEAQKELYCPSFINVFFKINYSFLF